MPLVNVSIDTLLNISKTADFRIVGSRSIYSQQPHPATGKKVEGWQWDNRNWPSKEEFQAAALAPSIWDPSVSGIDENLFQAGIGDNKNLLLTELVGYPETKLMAWFPKIEHGSYYVNNEEWYLYSDDYLVEQIPTTQTVSGLQYHLLSHDFKPTVPIQIRRFSFDKVTGRTTIDLDLRKVQEFNNPVEPEFLINTNYSPPKLELSSVWTEQIAGPVTVFPTDIQALEQLGYSDGTASQEFFTSYFPIDRSQTVEVWSWTHPVSGVQQWTTISGLNDFTVGDNTEVWVDYETGTLKFGDFNPSTGLGSGRIPTVGSRIGITYTKGLQAAFEPLYAKDHVIATLANTNPFSSSTNAGFVQLTTSLSEPGSITLTADLPKINPYLISLGNNSGKLRAEVKSTNGSLLEGYEVFFEILDPVAGKFTGNQTSTSAVTNSSGQALTFYNSPATIIEAGKGTATINFNGGNTIIDTPGLVWTNNLNRYFIYKVHTSDEVLGIPASGVDSYYSNYFTEENILETPSGSSVLANLINYEEIDRAAKGFDTPQTYDEFDLITGKKSIILAVKSSGVIDPDTGALDSTDAPLDVLSPLYPINGENIGSTESPVLSLTYSGILDNIGTNETKSYFLVGDSQTRLRAFTINPRTGAKLYSNTIEMRVTIPDGTSGSYICDDLNALPSNTINYLLRRPRDVSLFTTNQINATSGINNNHSDYLEDRYINETYEDWFKRRRRADSSGLLSIETTISGNYAPEYHVLTVAGEIPLGFRLKSSGLTLGAALSQITFFDPNSNLANDYYDTDQFTLTGIMP